MYLCLTICLFGLLFLRFLSTINLTLISCIGHAISLSELLPVYHCFFCTTSSKLCWSYSVATKTKNSNKRTAQFPTSPHLQVQQHVLWPFFMHFCCSKFLRMLLQLLRPAPLFYGSFLLYCIDHNLRQHMLNGGHKLYAAVSFTLFASFPLTFFVVSALNILQWQPGSINVNIDIRSTLTAPDLA